MTSMKVFFVVGAARSGTTLITRLLSAHPAIHLHHERRVLELAGVAGGLLRTGGRPNPPTPDRETLARDLVRGRNFANAVLRAGAPEGTRWFGDKYPPYSGQVSTLAAVWPEARFIHIVRDGRGVTASWMHTWPRDHAWRRGATVPSATQIAGSWARSVRLAHEAGQALGPERYLAFRYDDLLDDPVGTGQRWLSFLGESDAPAFTAALAQVKRRGDWRRDLSPREVADVEASPEAAATLQTWEWSLEADPNEPPDTAAEWTRRAEMATDEASARRAWLRVLRLAPGHPAAVRWLMDTQYGRGESLFALMNLRKGRLKTADEDVRSLLIRRGLDPSAAAVLFGESP